MNTIFFVSSLIYIHVILRSGWAMEATAEFCTLEFYNKSYFGYFNVGIHKRSRHSPYYLNLSAETYGAIGNNFTVNYVVMEYLSSGYQPTPFQQSLKLCDFYYEPFVGRLILSQLPPNTSCPLKKGKFNFTDIDVHSIHLPSSLPFTWQDIKLKTRVDFEVFKTGTKILLVKSNVYITINMKPAKKH